MAGLPIEVCEEWRPQLVGYLLIYARPASGVAYCANKSQTGDPFTTLLHFT